MAGCGREEAHGLRWKPAWALAAALALPAAARSAPSETSAAGPVLAAMRLAMGGGAWSTAGTLRAEGRKTSFGLDGRYEATESLRDGRFVRRADYGLMANAEGLDGAGRWRMDNSGGVHPLDSLEAQAAAVSEAFLARRGYLDPSAAAAYAALDPSTDGGRIFDRIAATPAGGRPLVLWIDRRDHRLARAEMARSSRSERWRFADYRTVAGLALPFRIETENGDQSETGIARIARYDVLAGNVAVLPPRPASRADARLAGRATEVWLGTDPVSGFALVEARIDAAPPQLFILDTGGHDILTPQAAQTLGLAMRGEGFSLGAGGGSAPTRYAKVDRLAIGGLALVDQPFLVLGLDLGQGAGPDGRRQPLAGIIGLEIFERFAADLDFPKGELRLCRFADAAELQGGGLIRFSDDVPLVLALLDRRPGWFQLDTGNNTQPILFKAWVEAAGLSGGFGLAGGEVAGSGVGGAVRFARGRAASLALAGERLEDLDILLAGENQGSLSARFEAGNLGRSVLSRFTASLDYRRERLFLARGSAAGLCG